MNGSDVDRSMNIVEDALRSYPLAPAPAALKTRVMNKIRPTSIVPRFTLPWLEAAIGLMCSTLLTAVVSLLLNIPPATAVRVENFARLFFLQPVSRSIVLAMGISVILSGMCLMLAMRLFRKPFGARLSPRH
jgi:hypothetical protein